MIPYLPAQGYEPVMGFCKNPSNPDLTSAAQCALPELQLLGQEEFNQGTAVKICKRCNERKRNQEFNKSTSGAGGLHSYCKPCFADYNRLQRYGIEAVDYQKLLKKQRNKCAICTKKLLTPVVDHCHTDGHVRGLLCGQCNSGIGQLGDNLLFVIAASSYLAKDLIRGRV